MILKNLSSLSILLGMKCNCKCPHCFYFPRDDNFEPLDPGLLGDALLSISGMHNIRSVNFAGGEPFYYFDTMLECIDQLKKNGIHLFSMSTNAGWACSVDKAREKLQILLKLGLGSMWVSADGFHQQTVPLDNVMNIITAGNIEAHAGARFSVNVVSTYLGYFSYDCGVNRQTNLIRKKIWDANVYAIETFVSPHGRGAFLIPDELQVNKKLDRKCWEVKLGMLDPEGPSMVSIDPAGHVDGCFGVSLGNLHDNSLRAIFRCYFHNPGPIVKILREKGPLGLKKFAVERGFVPQEAYFDECQLCHKTRNYLKEKCNDEFGEFLQPVSCYPPVLDTKKHPFEEWNLKNKRE